MRHHGNLEIVSNDSALGILVSNSQFLGERALTGLVRVSVHLGSKSERGRRARSHSTDLPCRRQGPKRENTCDLL